MFFSVSLAVQYSLPFFRFILPSSSTYLFSCTHFESSYSISRYEPGYKTDLLTWNHVHVRLTSSPEQESPEQDL